VLCAMTSAPAGRTITPATRPRDNLPVVNISWNDAKAYADWLSQRTGKVYRLPSEAEFEYALRGGTSTRYWWGDEMPTSWWKTSPAPATVRATAVAGARVPRLSRWLLGSGAGDDFRANPFGLYDINGNVSEWVQDCWHETTCAPSRRQRVAQPRLQRPRGARRLLGQFTGSGELGLSSRCRRQRTQRIGSWFRVRCARSCSTSALPGYIRPTCVAIRVRRVAMASRDWR
jgi:formylglycine-generating enzyme required for sulfatase activity